MLPRTGLTGLRLRLGGQQLPQGGDTAEQALRRGGDDAQGRAVDAQLVALGAERATGRWWTAGWCRQPVRRGSGSRWYGVAERTAARRPGRRPAGLRAGDDADGRPRLQRERLAGERSLGYGFRDQSRRGLHRLSCGRYGERVEQSGGRRSADRSGATTGAEYHDSFVVTESQIRAGALPVKTTQVAPCASGSLTGQPGVSKGANCRSDLSS